MTRSTTNGLPAPGASFEWRQAPWGDVLVCRELDPVASHFFTGRQLQLRGDSPDARRDWGQVADAMGVTDAGIFGDILCARMAKRKVAALITDGVMRDMEGVLATGLPVWCAGAAAPASVAGLTFVNWQEPVACGGVAVFPGDTIVADGDGAVVIPQAMVAEVTEMAAEQEIQEGWIMGEIQKGVPLPGLYPANAENKARYEAWKAGRG